MRFQVTLTGEGAKNRTVEFDFNYDATSLLEQHVKDNIATGNETILGPIVRLPDDALTANEDLGFSEINNSWPIATWKREAEGIHVVCDNGDVATIFSDGTWAWDELPEADLEEA
jgi:hypothetical protein